MVQLGKDAHVEHVQRNDQDYVVDAPATNRIPIVAGVGAAELNGRSASCNAA